mgnify:CR=1 FL=1
MLVYFHKTHMSTLLTQSIECRIIPLYLKNKLWMGIKAYRSCFQRVAGWCEAIEVVRWHSPVSFDGEYSSSHRRWFRYTRNESQLGWYRVMNITPLWATTVVLRGFFYTVKCWSEPPPAGSVYGLRPSQGQSRFESPIQFFIKICDPWSCNRWRKIIRLSRSILSSWSSYQMET